MKASVAYTPITNAPLFSKKTFLTMVALTICISVFTENAEADLQKTFYSQNSSLFTLPNSSALSGSDLCFIRNAAPSSNPANFTADSTSELALSYANFFRNTFSSSVLSCVTSLPDRSGLGVSLSYFYVPDIEITEFADTTSAGDPVIAGPFPVATSSEVFFRIGYARGFTYKGMEIDAGGALNAHRRRLIDSTGYGIGADLGLRVYFKSPGASLALLARNITTAYTYWNSNYKEIALPQVLFSAGISRDLPYIYGRFQLSYTSPDLLSNEGINSTADSIDNRQNVLSVPEQKSIREKPSMLLSEARYGLEYTIINRLALRAGFVSGEYTFGAGLNLFDRRAALDFAYLAHDLAGTYQLSVTYRW